MAKSKFVYCIEILIKEAAKAMTLKTNPILPNHKSLVQWLGKSFFLPHNLIRKWWKKMKSTETKKKPTIANHLFPKKKRGEIRSINPAKRNERFTALCLPRKANLS